MSMNDPRTWDSLTHYANKHGLPMCEREGAVKTELRFVTCTACQGLARAPIPGRDADPKAIIPDHYGGREDPYEVFKVIRAWEVNFFLGNALKYIRRAGKKDPSKHIEDLEKAKEYLQSEIDHLKKDAQKQNFIVAGTIRAGE